MGDYDVNSVEMSYRFVVFMALLATLSAAFRSGTTTVPAGSILSKKHSHLEEKDVADMALA